MHLHFDPTLIYAAVFMLGLVVPLIPVVISKRIELYVPLAILYMAWGFLFGKSLIGGVFPDMYAAIMDYKQLMEGLATFGIYTFVAWTGKHFNLADVDETRKEKGFYAVSAANLVLPTIIGMSFGYAALALDSKLAPLGVSAHAFAYATGILFATTAIPVLCNIMTELGLMQSKYKNAVVYAMIGDILLWPQMSFLQASSLLSLIGMLTMVLVYFVMMWFVVRPMLAKLENYLEQRGTVMIIELIIMIVGPLIVSAAITSFMGMHYLLGAFLYGLVMPEKTKQRMEVPLEVAFGVTVPFFFILPGLKVGVNLFSSEVLTLGLTMTLFAALAKIGSVALVKHYVKGTSWKQAIKFGALLNTRGTVEVAVATALRASGVIGEAYFAAAIIMTILCTFMTVPIVQWVWSKWPNPQEIDEELRFKERRADLARGRRSTDLHEVTSSNFHGAEIIALQTPGAKVERVG